MRARLKVGLDRLQCQIDEVVTAVGRHPDPFRAAAPSPGAWSPIQALQHLVLVHEGAAAVLTRTPAPLEESHLPSWWRPAAMRLVLRAGVRIKAPTPRVVPVASVPLGKLTERWTAAQATLTAALVTKAGRWADGGIFRHPLAGWLDTGQTLDFLSDHIDHHRRQIGAA